MKKFGIKVFISLMLFTSMFTFVAFAQMKGDRIKQNEYVEKAKKNSNIEFVGKELVVEEYGHVDDSVIDTSSRKRDVTEYDRIYIDGHEYKFPMTHKDLLENLDCNYVIASLRDGVGIYAYKNDERVVRANLEKASNSLPKDDDKVTRLNLSLKNNVEIVFAGVKFSDKDYMLEQSDADRYFKSFDEKLEDEYKELYKYYEKYYDDSDVINQKIDEKYEGKYRRFYVRINVRDEFDLGKYAYLYEYTDVDHYTGIEGLYDGENYIKVEYSEGKLLIYFDENDNNIY